MLTPQIERLGHKLLGVGGGEEGVYCGVQPGGAQYIPPGDQDLILLVGQGSIPGGEGETHETLHLILFACCVCADQTTCLCETCL